MMMTKKQAADLSEFNGLTAMATIVYAVDDFCKKLDTGSLNATERYAREDANLTLPTPTAQHLKLHPPEMNEIPIVFKVMC